MEYFKNLDLHTISLYENELFNYQDKVIIRLIIEGVTKEEMCNLIINDVDFDNNLIALTSDDGRIRTIKVSDRCLYLIKGAHNETLYAIKNGILENDKRTFTPLGESGYIIKANVPIDRSIPTKVSTKFIDKKIAIIKDYLGIETYRPKEGYRKV